MGKIAKRYAAFCKGACVRLGMWTTTATGHVTVSNAMPMGRSKPMRAGARIMDSDVVRRSRKIEVGGGGGYGRIQC